jgi:hypothetical protein
MLVQHRDDDGHVVADNEIHGVWKSTQQRSPRFLLDCGNCRGFWAMRS